MLLLKIILLSVSIISLFPVCGYSQTIKFNQVVFFGDSLSDASVASKAYPELSQGNSTWEGAPVTNSNAEGLSPMWPNFITKLLVSGGYLSGSPLVWPVRLVGSRKQSLKDGPFLNINYAVAGAITSNGFINDENNGPYPVSSDKLCHRPGFFKTYACVPGVLKQLNAYLESVKGEPNPHALYFIWAGGNDIFDNLLIMSDIIEKKKVNKILEMYRLQKESLQSSLRLIQPQGSYYQPVRNLRLALQILHQKNVPASHIFIIGLPDLTLIPFFLENLKNHWVMRWLIASMMSRYNAALKKYSSGQANFIPTAGVLAGFQKNKKVFTDSIHSCLEDKRGPLCKGYLFYNEKHISVHAHQVLSSYFYKQMKKDW